MGVWTPGPGATAGNDTFTGDGANETARGLAGEDTINGGGGNDLLEGGAGVDSVNGGEGNDRIQVREGDHEFDDAMDGGGGVDTLETYGENNFFYASVVGFERLYLAPDPVEAAEYSINTATFASGQMGAGISNTLLVRGSRLLDLVYVNASNDTDNIDVSGWTFSNWNGSVDKVSINGGAGNNTLTGTIYNDNVGGGDGADTLYAGLGNDELYAGPGGSADGDVDMMYGGGGNDMYGVFEIGDTVIELADEGSDYVAAWIDYTLPNHVEAMNMYDVAVVGTGNSLNNSIAGNALNNTISGAGGADSLYGQEGNDVLNGGSGLDYMVGGVGDDTYYVDNAGDTVTEDAAAGLDTVRSSITWALGANFENLALTGAAAINATGNALVNRITGNSANNLLDGGAGGDRMIGGGGDDRYYVDSTGDVIVENVGEGSDRVYSSVTYTLSANVERLDLTGTANINAKGSAGADQIVGNSGNNIINGSFGVDNLFGGAGNDVFLFDVAPGAANRDKINDFNPADDAIRLDDAVFSGLTTGVLAASAFRTGAAAADADDRIIYNSATGAVLFDADGNGAGAAVHFLNLSAGLGVTNTDFIVV